MMEKLLGKKWFSRDNLLLLVLLGVLLFVIALPVKKEDSGKGQEKEIAVETVKDYQKHAKKKMEVVFNVFLEKDYDIYRRLLGAD